MKLLRRIQYLFHRDRMEAELAEELEFHQTMLAEDTGDAQMARRAMGPATLMREDARAVWVWPWLQSVWQDLNYAVRGFRRQPGFTAIAVLALALAIGLNTSLFTVFNAVALRPWPVKDPGRVVQIFATDTNPQARRDRYHGFSLAEWRYLSEHSKTMSGLLLARDEGGLRLEGVKVHAQFVTGSFFDVLGVRMDRGRGFRPDEDLVDSPEPVAVISWAAWQNQFGGDPNIVARKVVLEDIPFTIVGVTPREFTGITPEREDIFLPMATMAQVQPADAWARDFLHSSNACCAEAAGRLAPGVSRAQAASELSVLTAAYDKEHNEAGESSATLTPTAFLQRPGGKSRQIRTMFGVMFVAVLLVLMLACANVGNLLLARSAARRREIAVRLSLGAARRRLVRQFLTESLALAAAAGAAGIAIAYFLPGPLFRQAVNDATFDFTPDVRVLAFTLAISVLACVAFGLAPALQATRRDPSDALKDRNGASSRLALRSVLLAVQVSISVILLVSAGLLVRGIQRAHQQDPGFEVKDTAYVSFDFPANAYHTPRMAAFFDSLEQALEQTPGLTPHAFASSEPLGSSHRFTGFRMPGEREDQTRMILFNGISPEYFAVLKIPVIAGRNLDAHDAGRNVVLINQAAARRHFPGENPIGKSIVMDKPFEIVGVVGDAHTWSLDEIEANLYFPVTFEEPPRLLVRNSQGNAAVIAAIARRLDTGVRTQWTPMSVNLESWLSSSRAGALIAGILGMLALTLATIGVGGVFAYAVQQRTQEIGIRMALGARPAQVTAVVMSWAGRSLMIGLVIGLAGAVAASQLIRQFLYGLSAMDPITYVGVAGIMAGAAGIAAWHPARRATRIDPIRALRCD